MARKVGQIIARGLLANRGRWLGFHQVRTPSDGILHTAILIGCRSGLATLIRRRGRDG